MSKNMRDVLKGKIERNEGRIEFWKWCIEYVKEKKGEYRIKYEKGNFFLEKREKTWYETIWIRTMISDNEV